MEHIHEHSNGCAEHTHPHDHDHEHTHPHSHDHGAQGEGKVVAVLTYMLEHNVHHCAELREMAAGLSGEAQHQLLHAVEEFDAANSHLAKAVEELKAQEKE